MAEWAEKQVDLPVGSKGKVFYLGAQKKHDYDCTVVKPEVVQTVERLKGRFIFLYVGSFSYICDPSVLIKIASRLQAEGRDDIAFVLAGAGSYQQRMKADAKGMSNVAVFDWLNEDELFLVTQHSQVGLFTQQVNRSTLPNKLFHYIVSGLPIIVGASGEARSVVEDNKIGLHYEPGNTEDLYRVICKLADHPELYNEMCLNVDKIKYRFEASHIYQKFVHYLESKTEDVV